MVKKNLHIILIITILSFISEVLVAQQPSVYKVKSMSFNTGAFSEISPVIIKDGIIFCSDRRFSSIKDRTAWDGRRLYNLYIAERKDTSDWRKPVELKSERSSLFNCGPLCFAPDGKTVYFTSEVETGKVTRKKNFKNHSGIFIAELSGTDLVSVHPFKYNNPQYEVGHPSVSHDGKYLFFASDMPGGVGASDLYYCELINGEWGTPVNLGPQVNSPGVDIYPYMHPSGRLYFASKRSGGIGNLDIYYTILSMGKWDEPVLLPEPINSQSDDFAFVAESNLQTGYFTSKRDNNDDIFQFSSTIIRKASCDTLKFNNYCYEFFEENAVKFDTMPFRYEWKFGDGGKGIGSVVQHCFAGAGNYIVQLDVVNLITKEVLFNEKTYNLEIKDVEQPYISSPDVTTSGKLIKINADSTNLPGWNIGRYYWNFGDETIAIGRDVDKTYLKPGTYNIQLIVSTEPEPGGIVREACVSKNINIIRQP
jgi:hypothetical protein